ncbi:hypothetical protein B0A50_03092 [Salinomyces thailandicus]|uniref:Uncharacterized protein n=1 Tax=Salinomyces thailandicus TaxID=706561 RepID=A0A4V5N4Z3_9PEZI|nr:hypothetical protein B0A50_03092 [Salinomyces thailandica]
MSGLLEAGASICATDAEGKIPLRLVIEGRVREQVVGPLSEWGKADLRATDGGGVTPLGILLGRLEGEDGAQRLVHGRILERFGGCAAPRVDGEGIPLGLEAGGATGFGSAWMRDLAYRCDGDEGWNLW